MRVELIHPMLVHFPIALLLVGMLLKCAAFFLKSTRSYRYVRITTWIVLGIGVCFAWLAILAGEFASDIVRKKLCLPEILDDHSLLAYTATYLFTIALLIDWGIAWGKNRGFSPRFLSALTVVCSLLFLGATIILILVGFFGGSLVYEQGAAIETICR